MCDNPVPRCSFSSMLPVPHQTCTLTTGALRSSCTMMVSPFGRRRFCAVLGGKVMPVPLSDAAAFRWAVNIQADKSVKRATRLDFKKVSVLANELALLGKEVLL